MDDVSERRDTPPPSVDTIRREAEARLRELEPVLEEAEKLRGVLAVIDGAGAGAGAGAGGGVGGGGARSPVGTGSSAGRRPHGRTTASGANKQRILAVIAAHPGITPREIALHTGIKRSVVASTVNRLKRRGEVRAHSAPGRRGAVAPIDAG
jgi:hypothetical protein